MRDMGFFEPPEPPSEQPPPVSLPEWIAPPVDVLGALVPLELMAARSDVAAVLLESATAYPAGVQVRIDVRWRSEAQGLVMRAGGWHYEHRAGQDLPDELFRAGFELADGSKATWLGPGGGVVATAVRTLDETPKGPLLVPGAGAGGDRRWSQDLWLWPLPPEGRPEFVCEWPALGIALTRAKLDARQIRAMAQRAETLWPNDEGPATLPPRTTAFPPL
jgi:hypothetical protein